MRYFKGTVLEKFFPQFATIESLALVFLSLALEKQKFETTALLRM